MRKVLITVASFAVVLAGVVSVPTASAAVTCPTVDPVSGAVTAPTPAPGVDWSGCDLTGAFLLMADLTGANLTGANLTVSFIFIANLTSANLTGANLTEAYVGSSTLIGANFTGANFTDATVQGGTMTGANLTGANFTNAELNVSLAGVLVSCSNTGILGTGVTGTPTNVPTGWTFAGGTLSGPIVICASAASPTPIMMWMHSVARESATASCPTGYAGSWATWPNGGKGGYVCDKFVPIYGN